MSKYKKEVVDDFLEFARSLYHVHSWSIKYNYSTYKTTFIINYTDEFIYNNINDELIFFKNGMLLSSDYTSEFKLYTRTKKLTKLINHV